MTFDETPSEREEREEPEDEPGGEPGAEGESSAAERLPGAPAPDDETPVGDTDQHSDAYGD
jgi:hypothetical protein